MNEKSPPLLWYRRPADHWVEALPVGNGRLGAMVFGGVFADRIQFNEQTLWSGGPYQHVAPNAAAHLPRLRQLIFAGQIQQAETLAARHMMPPTPGSASGQLPDDQPERDGTRGAYTGQLQAYLPMGDVHLTFPGHEQGVKDYRRQLDLDRAMAQVSYTTAAGVRYTRQVFASHRADLIVICLSCDGPQDHALDVDLAITSPHDAAGVQSLDSTTLRLHGRLGPRRRPDPPPFGAECVAEWNTDGLAFEAQLRVRLSGGTCRAVGDRLEIRAADQAILLLTAATSYRDPNDIIGDPHHRVQAIFSNLADAPADALADVLVDQHVADHQRLFRRVQLTLPAQPTVAALPTDERIVRHGRGETDPALAALLFDYGRYLMIASSRPGTLPATAVGLWNDQLWPSWGAKWTLNINTQMNYWPAEVCDLGQCHQPLFDFLESLRQSAGHVARQHYACRGFTAHHNTDLWRAAGPVDNPSHLWPMAVAWLCTHLWEHYRFNPDDSFLRDHAYPLMTGAAAFITDFLVEAPPDSPFAGCLVTNPSVSPENRYRRDDGVKGALTYAATMDLAIIRELLGACIAAAERLNTDPTSVRQWHAVIERLPPYQIGRLGQLQEWIEDWDDPDDHHRHVSHLFALFPGSQLIPRLEPDLAAAAAQSLKLRGDDGTGWALAWKTALWARLLDGRHAHQLLCSLLRPAPVDQANYEHGGVYPNLFDAHPPFQIDGNFGATAAIAEMLLQSHQVDDHGAVVIELLPALAPAWPHGSVRGLRARGGVGVELTWHNHALADAVLRASQKVALHVRTGKHQLRQTLTPGQVLHLDSTLTARSSAANV